jgi:hypothetical protein
MLFRKRVEVALYESLFQDQDALELKRPEKERDKEQAWKDERMKTQLAAGVARLAIRKQENGREMSRRKRVAAEQKMIIARVREQGGLTQKREAQEAAQKAAKENARRAAAARLKERGGKSRESSGREG